MHTVISDDFGCCTKYSHKFPLSCHRLPLFVPIRYTVCTIYEPVAGVTTETMRPLSKMTSFSLPQMTSMTDKLQQSTSVFTNLLQSHNL